jgi:hypothetical protein
MWPNGLWYCTVLWVVTNVLEECIASIFKAEGSSSITEDLAATLKSTCCQNLTLWLFILQQMNAYSLGNTGRTHRNAKYLSAKSSPINA